VPSFDHCGLTPQRSDSALNRKETASETPAAGPTPLSTARVAGGALSVKRSPAELNDAVGDANATEKSHAVRRLTFASSDDGTENPETSAGAMPPPPRPVVAPNLESPLKRAKHLEAANAGTADAQSLPATTATEGPTVEPPTPCLPAPGAGSNTAAQPPAHGPQHVQPDGAVAGAQLAAPDQSGILSKAAQARPSCLHLPAIQEDGGCTAGAAVPSASSTGKGSANSSFDHVERGTLSHHAGDLISACKGEGLGAGNRSNLYKSQLDNLMDAVFSSV
jgi:hypothetical protein